jgi:2-polyprenyl-6-methoxyphenol hydroxylase-like FAD-dependent oxidoreductase
MEGAAMADHDALDGPVLIVGAGIAGSALAAALGQRGIASEVIDLDDRTDGAHIGLTNRAVDVLDDLGVLEAAVQAGAAHQETVFVRMYLANGDPIPIPPPPRPDTDLPAAVTIYRPVLSDILTGAAKDAGAVFRYGLSIEAFEQDATGVNVSFTDGGAGRYALVVGADGVHSRVRELLHPQLKPAYTGTVALRWMLDEDPPGPPGFYNSAGEMVAIAPVKGGMTYVASGAESPEGHRVEQAEARQMLRAVLERFPAPTPTALREKLTDDQSILVHPFEWILVPSPWHRGRLTVIGDAAHATTALLSSGGGMALEDAMVLAQELAQATTVESALDGFMRRRFERVRVVVEASVKLLEMQRAGESQMAMGMLRTQATLALIEPY